MPESNSINYALDDLKQRWVQDPGSRRLFLQLAEEYRKLGQPTEAEGVLVRGLEHRPNDVAGLAALGRCRLDLGNVHGAIESLAAVIARDPTHILANKLLVEAHLQRKDPEKAGERLEIYRLLNGRDPELDHLELRLHQLRTAPEETAVEDPEDETIMTLDEVLAPAAEETVEDTPEPPESEELASHPEVNVAPEMDTPEMDTPEMDTAPEPFPAVDTAPTPAPDPFPAMASDPLPVAPAASATPASGNEIFNLGSIPPPPTPSLDDLWGQPSTVPVSTTLASTVMTPEVEVPEESAESTDAESTDAESTDAESTDEMLDTQRTTFVWPSQEAVVPETAEVTEAIDVIPAKKDLDETHPVVEGFAATPEVIEPAPIIEPPSAVESVAVESVVAVEPPAEPTAEATPAAEAADQGFDLSPFEFATPTADVEETTSVEPPPAPEPAAAEPLPPEPAAAPQPTAAESQEDVAESQEDAAATVTLGGLYLKQGHLEEAANIFEKVLAGDPDNVAARAGLSLARPSRDKPLTAMDLLSGPSLAGTIPAGLTAKKITVLNNYLQHLRSVREN